MKTLFSLVTLLGMCLCFFSLSQSMSSNIFDQSKEISLLLSIGMQKATLIRVYLYEAVILVVTNALIGFSIGTLIGNSLVYLLCLLLTYPFIP